MRKAAALSFALVLITSGCSESATGNGGAAGIAGSGGVVGGGGDAGSAGNGGAAGEAGSGGSSGSGGDAGTGGEGGSGGTDLCSAVECDDGNDCTDDVCNRGDGLCDHTNRANGAQCDLGALPGVCEGGVCVKERSWGTPVLIETSDAGDAAGPDVKMDLDGNALAVWRQFDGARYNIYANRYVQGTGWGTAELIETNDEGPGAFSEEGLDFDATGNALTVWIQQSEANTHEYHVWSNRYDAGAGWGTAELIEIDGRSVASHPRIAIAPNGNALAVWTQSDDVVRYNIWSNRYTAGVGWGTAQPIETDKGPAVRPSVAIDPNGNALAVWNQSDGVIGHNIWSNRYTAGVGWGTAQLIETNDAGSAEGASIAIDPNGNALAVWKQWDDGHDIWSNRYTAGVGWGTAELIENINPGFAAEGATVAIDPNGNGLAVWNHYNGVRYNIWSNRYTAGVGWGTAEVIDTDDAGATTEDPSVAIDPGGNALAVWQEWDGVLRHNIWSNRYTAGVGWGTAQLIETDDAGHAYEPSVAIDRNGNALAVWKQWDGTRHSIWSNRFE